MFLRALGRMLSAEPSRIRFANDDSVEALMFEPARNDRIVQRGIDEAMACRDMLSAPPPTASRLARLIARLGAPARWLASRRPRSAPRTTPAGARGR